MPTDGKACFRGRTVQDRRGIMESFAILHKENHIGRTRKMAPRVARRMPSFRGAFPQCEIAAL